MRDGTRSHAAIDDTIDSLELGSVLERDLWTAKRTQGLAQEYLNPSSMRHRLPASKEAGGMDVRLLVRL